MNYLTDYPRPQFKRDSYLSLNGIWRYKISKSDAIPEDFDGNIIVPFSPETEMNKDINHILQPDEYLFYKLVFKAFGFKDCGKAELERGKGNGFWGWNFKWSCQRRR